MDVVAIEGQLKRDKFVTVTDMHCTGCSAIDLRYYTEKVGTQYVTGHVSSLYEYSCYWGQLKRDKFVTIITT